MIKVTGKGKKERLVPIGSHAVKAIKEYLNSESKRKKDEKKKATQKSE